MVAEVLLTKGLVAFVDEADLEKVLPFTWEATRSSRGVFYARTRVRVAPGPKGRVWLWMHHLILPRKAGYLTDHRDGNGLNNQSGNLRYATKMQNNNNRRVRRDCFSGFRGVTAVKNQWRATIMHDGHPRQVAVCSSAVAAAFVYDVWAIALHGEFARPNLGYMPTEGGEHMLARDRILELSEQLDEELSKPVVSISAVKALNRHITEEAERHTAVLKTIQDLARYGQPSIRTQRWVTALTKSAPDGWTPDAA